MDRALLLLNGIKRLTIIETKALNCLDIIAFFTYLKVAFFGAVFCSFPMWATQLWLFVAPHPALAGLVRQIGDGRCVLDCALHRHRQGRGACYRAAGLGALSVYVLRTGRGLDVMEPCQEGLMPGAFQGTTGQWQNTQTHSPARLAVRPMANGSANAKAVALGTR